MFKTFLFVGYLRRMSNYLERLRLSSTMHMISMIDPVTIGVETLMIDIGFLKKKSSLN